MVEVTAKSALVAVTLICTALFSGALFGWATLQLIFEKDGVFSSGCEEIEDEICEKQQEKFSLMYNVISTFFSVGSVFWGFFVDRMGPVWSSLVSGMCISTGMLLFGISGNEDMASLIVGGICLAVGGGLTLLNSFTLGYVLDQEHMALVLSTVNCLFDASGVTFLFVYLLYTHLDVSRRSIFIGMALIAATLFLVLTAMWCLVEHELKTRKDAVFEASSSQQQQQQQQQLKGGGDEDDEGREETELVERNRTDGADSASSDKAGAVQLAQEDPDEDEDEDAPPPRDTAAASSGSQGQGQGRKSSRTVLEKHSTPWLKEMQSRSFIFGVVFGSMCFFRVNVMFGTILDILKYLGDEDTGFLYTQIFIASLPLGFITIPFITYCLKNFGLVHTFHFIIFLGCGYGIFIMIPVLELQLVTFLFFSFFRAFLFSVMAYFSVHRFGPINSGKLYGLTMSIAGAFNFLNYPMVLVVNDHWDGDYFYYNLIQFLFFIPLLLTVHCLLKPVVDKLDDMCLVTASSPMGKETQKAQDESSSTPPPARGSSSKLADNTYEKSNETSTNTV